MRGILLGKPGSGKGTQGKRLALELGIPNISTGDLIRSAIAEGNEHGQEFKSYTDKGQLVPDRLVVDMVKERLAEKDAKRGFLLDGFPRTVPQAEALEQLLQQLKRPLDAVLYIVVPDDVLLERATGRRYCPNDGQTYHVKFAPPRIRNTCDQCGGPLEIRKDDREEVVKERIAEYRDKTEPLLEFYRGRSILRSVDGMGTPDEVSDRIRASLDGRAGAHA
jgi:adenylate kinase